MRRTKEDAEKTRQDILNAAIEVFSDKGVERAALSEIAKKAGVTRGAIYWHFDSKVDIFDALYYKLHQPFFELVLSDVEKDHPEPLLQLKELCKKILINLDEDVERRSVLKLFLLKCDYEGEFAPYKNKYRKGCSERFDTLVRYLERAKAKGQLSADADVRTILDALGCFMQGILLEYLHHPDQFNINERAPSLIELFFRNIGLQK